MDDPTVSALMPFIPAKDFEISRQFFVDLGFSPGFANDEIVQFKLGAANFFLQKFYLKEWAENTVMKVWVPDLQAWAQRIADQDILQRYPDTRMVGPKKFPWGLTEIHLIDPAGVLWQFAENE